MNEGMQYNIYFEYASILVIVVVLILFLMRRSFVNKSSRFFIYFMADAILTTVVDIVSAYAISFPYRYPLWFDYFVCILYLFCYISGLLLFVLYTDALAKISSIEKLIKNTVRGLFIYEVIICSTSPWTKLLVYFDENRDYLHGPLLAGNYAIGVLGLIAAGVIIVRGRVRFAGFQQVALSAFLLGVLICNGIQLFYPHLLLAGFNFAIMSIFMYVTFENPAYFYYKDTKLQNQDAFYRIAKLHMRENKPFSLVIGQIHEYENTTKFLRAAQRGNLSRWIADNLSATFKAHAFMLSLSQFAVMVPGNRDDLTKEEDVEKRFRDIFGRSINLADRMFSLSVDTCILPAKYSFSSTHELEAVLDILFETLNYELQQDTYERVEKAIQKKKRHDELVHVVEKAIENNTFMVYYQPILNVETGKFESAEALVRLIDDEIGFVSPEEFIPVTEDVGLILPLGEIVFRKVCEFINSLDVDKLGLKYIEVNLSPLQCEKKDISDTMFNIMSECGTNPRMINFEITETAESEFSAGSTVVDNIRDMNERGVGFSIDDFGSGFAAMDHLFQLPIELVKVDKGILWQAMKDEKAMVVLKNTFRMVQELHKKILVEGVETQEMVDVLKQYGCHYMQGYFFSKPIPENEFVDFLRGHNASAM